VGRDRRAMALEDILQSYNLLAYKIVNILIGVIVFNILI